MLPRQPSRCHESYGPLPLAALADRSAQPPAHPPGKPRPHCGGHGRCTPRSAPRAAQGAQR